MKRGRSNEEVIGQNSMHTYCSGPRFSSPFPITSKTIVDFVDALSERFGPGYEFKPEPISEGGIEMTSWPGKDDPRAYKTVRFHMVHGQWPIIQRDTLDQWRINPPVEIWTLPPRLGRDRAHTLEGSTFFKAFYGAPCWTRESAGLVMDALNSVGFKCIKSSLPKNKDLQSFGELGDPALSHRSLKGPNPGDDKQ